MGYRGCLGIIRLAAKYSPQRVEAACERALLTSACRYRSVEPILKNSLDQTPVSSPPPTSTPLHDNIRGAGYFGIGGDHATRTDDGKADAPNSRTVSTKSRVSYAFSAPWVAMAVVISPLRFSTSAIGDSAKGEQ
jgi:hypothetical protein